MKNSKKSEKSRGLLAFANNTKDIDYVSIAKKTLQVASQILGIPYILIDNISSDIFNTRYDIDLDKHIQWNNFNRYQAYELSPFDETIVIDADYLILNDSLNKIFNFNYDYLLQRNSYALTQHWPNSMGSYSLPFVWATVFAFRKTKRAKLFFDLVKRVQDNYGYYHSLFNLSERNFRNDYAFAIADYILNGYIISEHSIPGNMLTVDQVIDSITVDDSQLIIKDKNKSYVIPRTNIHIMSKAYLQSDNFTQLINSL